MNKKILKFMALLAIVFATSSCLKDEDYDNQQYGTILSGTPASSLKSVRILEGGIDGGDIRRSQLAFANTTAALDSSSFSIAYFDNKSLSPVAPATITVTLGKDPGFIATYNASQAIQYELMPDSLFSIPTLTTTIAAGQQFSQPLKIYFKPIKFNSAKIYMLPIKILTATGVDGVTIQANYAYIIFSKIGNPIAGTYTVVGTRYNCTVTGDQGYAGGPIPANFVTATIPSPKVLDVVSPTVTTTYVANLGAGTNRDYFFDINPSATTIQDIGISLTPSFDAGISNVRWLTKTYDPVTKKITLLWTYNNQPGGVGNDRIIQETMTKQ